MFKLIKQKQQQNGIIFLQYSLEMMNANIKIKSKSKEQNLSRRIRTEFGQNPKKINLYLNRPPLHETKKYINQSDSHQTKKTKNIKTVLAKQPQNISQMSSKLVTEPLDKTNFNAFQKNAVEKLFGNRKIVSTSYQNNQSGIFKKQSKENYKQKQNINKSVNLLSGSQRYVFEEKVGSGTFGTVHKARDKRTLEIVAIKKVYQDRKYKNRQLEILKILNHPNVLQMKDNFFTYEGQKQYLNVVMDHYPVNLYETIMKFKKGQMPRLMVKTLTYQLIRSLLYLQNIGIAHRDIKPHNVLVNDVNWKLVLCDFGSAKKLIPGEPNIAYICSRCYRAPQLIFGNTNYSTQIDMWSVGCILAQMVMMEPIFKAESNIDQLVEIVRVLGSPSERQISEMNPQAQKNQYQIPKIGARPWAKVLKNHLLGDQFVDLLSKILTYSPIKRLNPYKALLHPFFDQLKEQRIYKKLKQNVKIPDLFDFRDSKEVDQSLLASLIPKWHK